MDWPELFSLAWVHSVMSGLGTTLMQERFGQGPRSMVHMGAPEVGLPTTRARNNTRAGAPPMDHTVHEF
jgi:hypothetical protein